VGRKISSHTDWALEKEVKFLKEEIKERDMQAADVLPLCKKKERVQPYLEKSKMLWMIFKKDF
jgi:hypothetical protein